MRWSVFIFEGSLPGRRRSRSSLQIDQVSVFISLEKAFLRKWEHIWGVWGRFFCLVLVLGDRTKPSRGTCVTCNPAGVFFIHNVTVGKKTLFSLYFNSFSSSYSSRGHKMSRGGVWGGYVYKFYFLGDFRNFLVQHREGSHFVLVISLLNTLFLFMRKFSPFRFYCQKLLLTIFEWQLSIIINVLHIFMLYTVLEEICYFNQSNSNNYFTTNKGNLFWSKNVYSSIVIQNYMENVCVSMIWYSLCKKVFLLNT